MSRRRRRSGGREREDYKYSVVGAWTKLAADPPAAHNLQPVNVNIDHTMTNHTQSVSMGDFFR